MMAYLRELKHLCEYGPCTKTAVVELVTDRNEVYGAYCRIHGLQKLRELQTSEGRTERSRA